MHTSILPQMPKKPKQNPQEGGMFIVKFSLTVYILAIDGKLFHAEIRKL